MPKFDVALPQHTVSDILSFCLSAQQLLYYRAYNFSTGALKQPFVIPMLLVSAQYLSESRKVLQNKIKTIYGPLACT